MGKHQQLHQSLAYLQARPPRKTDFTHTPDQLWHIAAENQRTVKRLMDISHRRSEWIGVQESKVLKIAATLWVLLGRLCARDAEACAE